MSTLASKVDVLRGWPNGQAIEESFTVKTGDTIYEGQLCQLQSDGTVSDTLSAPPVVGEADKDGVIANRVAGGLYFVITGNDANTFDGNWLGKVVTLRGPMTVKTDQFAGTTGDYSVGEAVTWTTGGQFDALDAAYTQTLGVVEAINADGSLTLQLNLP